MIKISPLEITLGAFCLGYAFQSQEIIDFGLALYQTVYIEPIKQVEDETYQKDKGGV